MNDTDSKTPWEDDRSPLKSKKFIAYILAEATWKVIILVTLLSMKVVLVDQVDHGDAEKTGFGVWWFIWTVVLVAGFIEAGYIGGQAWLDKYVRLAKITANGNQKPGSDGTGRDSKPSVPPEFDEPEGEGPMDPPKEDKKDA